MRQNNDIMRAKGRPGYLTKNEEISNGSVGQKTPPNNILLEKLIGQ